MATLVRRLVSKKRRRFERGGFDLDLSYISDRIIAMSFPSEASLEGLFRNKMNDVEKFFDTSHKDAYKVYNLCAERKYDHSRFDGRVCEYPFAEHNAPPLDLILNFCVDAGKFLEDATHVVAVHCKSGKGRTGTFIACLLLWLKYCKTASEAVQLFSTKRMLSGRGITVPSQERFVHYWEQIAARRTSVYSPPPPLPERKTVVLTNITLNGIPKVEGGTCEPWVSITQRGKTVYHSKPLKLGKETAQAEIPCDSIVIMQEVFVQFYHKSSKVPFVF
eukprot:TRINITY_DN1298_c0_g1_i5.p1 TRINITY_DN1298_c0_g1~~TRINITY_DN1298_c0_g1_i5.p1  ORF type:complete len:276 (-),score=57.79 TRINITY_DN1298_c0_g1_i5:1364-2191(-)